MQPLNGNGNVGANVGATSNTLPSADQNNSGVVLRWRTSARVNNGAPASGSQANSNTAAPINSATNAASSTSLAARAFEANATRSSNSIAPTSSGSSAVGNPLRSSVSTDATQAPTRQAATFVPRGTHASQRSSVQPANFQAPAGNPQPGFAPPAAPRRGLQDNSIAPPSIQNLDNSAVPQAPIMPEPPSNFPPSNFPPAAPLQDALTLPEDAPAPPVAPPVQNEFPPTPAEDSNPAAPMPDTDNDLRQPDNSMKDDAQLQDDTPNPFKNRGNDESASDRKSAERSRELEQKKDPDSTANCESFRDKLRNSSIQKINLNAAPRFGQGMNDDPERAEKLRLDFASSSEVRDWCDRRGRTLIQGRMIDLINEQVVLDINGVRREVPLRDLCDVDLAYVGKVWHLPVTCGSGYDQVPGRSFEPSAIQWKASGLCHKPLYFEEVQLERYGHEIGPILQPLVSTAHFFGNIAVLPYKMGIHPPNECQYALGYYRPGDCAPYMLPPVPISLRGAAVQAAAVVGGAALVP